MIAHFPIAPVLPLILSAMTLAAVFPTASLSGHITTSRPCKMFQFTLSALDVPPSQDITVYSGNNSCALSAVFSPSTTSTGLSS